MRVLLDSNAYSRLMRGDEQAAAVVRDATEVLMSAVVVGELLYGFRNGSRFDRNASDLRSFLDNPYVSFVPVGSTTADRYSRIAAALRAKGHPIPTNDVWIAAHAMETGADLVSADRHFEAVDGIAWLRLDNR
jgi:tRNA(fMet)-specific endonuclease VapC